MGNFHAPRSCAWALAMALGLAGCPTVDLGDTPVDINTCNPAGGIDYFTNVIYPMYLKADARTDTKSCTQDRGCHANGDGTPFNLLIGNQRDDTTDFKAAQQFLNCGAPEDSTMLTRPLIERDSHGGQGIFDENSPEHQMFLDWFK